MTERKAQIKRLEELYQQDGNQLVILYGRRENGIRELLQDFCKEKKSFYYYAPEVSAKAQQQRMIREVEKQYDVSLSEESYDSCFSRVKSGDASKLVLIIDEFEHIVKKDQQFMESILKLKQHKLYPGPVMILLYTSAVAWAQQNMFKTLEKYKKKIDATEQLSELKFVEMVQSFPDYTVSQSVEVYGVIGGVQEYMEKWDESRDIRYNICKHILSPDGFLFGEAERIISKELREFSVYNTILEALASGKRKLNDLYQETGFSRAKISVYLKNLMAFDMVEKVTSFETGGWENAQKGLYQIKDTFINFWFKFVYPHLSDLYRMEPEKFYDTYIANGLEEYLNRYFVKVCAEYLELMNQVHKLPLQMHKMGTWIGKQGHIDIIVQNEVRENLICLCNWSEPEMTFEMCQKLFQSMEQAKLAANYYYLFSAKSFDEKLRKMVSADKRILLVDMNQL
ncbi:ATP-binding protein [Roseburia sp. 499]|uniref:ATP-binding protein n=1 Tax=Roseburia sp. 499 TaxID=1261634 RepID=UPI00095181BF|nr:ATP-binding protein [Roseburia sp. 499]WVK71548.1 ATP-binding protein [Roseburia sp. 499]